VLVNLVAKADKAARPGQGCHITIGLETAEPDVAFVEVRDDGVGMTPEVQARIFDPFFTTREVGQGMGIGLPVCHSIVTAHGGTITGTSAPGEGATFRVELPAAVA
jgi:signal transduction histidine kinase